MIFVSVSRSLLFGFSVGTGNVGGLDILSSSICG
jgi:hypothetical protein